jgi:serine/threonine protein kinase
MTCLIHQKFYFVSHLFLRSIIVRPTSVEFIVHMSLAAGVASVCSLSNSGETRAAAEKRNLSSSTGRQNNMDALQPLPFRSEHVGTSRTVASRPQPMDSLSITGARLDLQWRQLSNVEYLTDGGNSWIHTAVFQGRPVVVKTLKPECQDVAVAINEIEGELSIHSRLDHPNIVSLLGAGLTSKGVRFFVLERLDGGTLTQMLGYETRIRDRRRRFWRRKMFSFLDVLRIARSIAEAMKYCHESAIPGSIVLHRDLKPDNIGKW